MEGKFENNESTNINIREELEKYLIHWRWFVLSILITLILAFIYLRYTEKTYKVNTTIVVKDEKRGGGISTELSAFADLGMLSGGKSNLENETQVLSSRTLAERTVRRLQLNISYISEGRLINSELYNNNPIDFNFIERVFDFDNISYTFYAKDITETSFTLLNKEKVKLGTFEYNTPIETILGKLVVTRNQPKPVATLDKLNLQEKDPNENEEIKSIIIEITPIEKVTDYYVKNVQITPTDKFSSILDLSLLSPTPAKAVDYLDNLITLYNDAAIADKRYISEKTSEFIDSRLKLITDELSDVEKTVEGYKSRNSITDIPTELGLFLQDANVYDKQIIENETELKVVSSLIEFLKNSKQNELLPNLISSDANVNAQINQYNVLVLDRNRISSSSTDLNPTVVKYDDQISAMRASVAASLTRLESSLKITKKELESKENQLRSKLSQVPRQEREFRIIDRQQKVKEAIYLYLFQKREETAITLAATDLNAKVIDTAKSSDKPVSPKKMIVLLAALVLGGLIPFAIIYLRLLLDTKVKNRLDIENNTNVPFLGDIPHSDDNENIIDLSSRSS